MRFMLKVMLALLKERSVGYYSSVSDFLILIIILIQATQASRWLIFCRPVLLRLLNYGNESDNGNDEHLRSGTELQPTSLTMKKGHSHRESNSSILSWPHCDDSSIKRPGLKPNSHATFNFILLKSNQNQEWIKEKIIHCEK